MRAWICMHAFISLYALLHAHTRFVCPSYGTHSDLWIQNLLQTRIQCFVGSSRGIVDQCSWNVSKPGIHTNVYGVSTSQQSAPGWGTDGLHIVIIQDDSIISQSVDVRCRNLL